MKHAILAGLVAFTFSFLGILANRYFRRWPTWGARRQVRHGDADLLAGVCTWCWYRGCCKECPEWMGP